MGRKSEGVVGHARELAALDHLLSDTCAGAANAVFLSGEPAIGKTHLMGELVRLAERRGCLVLEGSAAEFEQELPFGVAIDAVDAYLESLDVQSVDRLAVDGLQDLAHVFPALRSLRSTAGSPPTATERFRSYYAVRELLERLAARQPLVLILDDLHWADGASIELVAHLIYRPPEAPILVAGSFRNQPPRRGPRPAHVGPRRAHRPEFGGRRRPDGGPGHRGLPPDDLDFMTAWGTAAVAAAAPLGDRMLTASAQAVLAMSFSFTMDTVAAEEHCDTAAASAELERAAADFDSYGAHRWRDLAEHELRLLGPRVHRRSAPGKAHGDGVEALSARELEVARLVVNRRTNPEIAADLFLSLKTVESHMRNIFRKLDVTSRVEVARRVERAPSA